MSSTQAPIVDRIRIIPRPNDFLDRNVGSSGEVFFNKATNSLRVYSGKDAGGFEIARSDLTNISNTVFAAKAAAAGISGGGSSGGGSAELEVSENPPSGPSQGSLWFNLNSARLYVFIEDGDTGQWVQPAVPASSGGSAGFAAITVGENNLIASGADTLTIAEGSGISISADTETNVITISSSSITSLSNLTSLGFESGVAIDEFSSDVTLGDDSNTAVPTESAVKTYVDTVAATKSPLLNPGFSETVSISNTDAQENAFEIIFNSSLVASITAEGVTSIPEISVSNDSFLARTYETVDIIANASGIVPLNQTQAGSVFYFTTPAGNFTCNFDNIDTSVNRSISYAVVINQGATAYMPTGVQVNNSPVTVKWLGGTGTPLGNSNQVDVIGFTIIVINNAVAQVIANAASYA